MARLLGGDDSDSPDEEEERPRRRAWSGEGRPPADGSSWKMGDDFTGDPPSEAQGANSIFDTDISTLEVLRRHATALGEL